MNDSSEEDLLSLTKEELVERIRKLRLQNRMLRANKAMIDRQRQLLGALTTTSTQLTNLSKEINSTDLNIVIEVAISRIPHLFDASYAALYLYRDLMLEFELAKDNFPVELDEKFRWDEGNLFCHAFGLDGPVLIGRPEAFFERAGRKFDLTPFENCDFRNMMICPLMVGGARGRDIADGDETAEEQDDERRIIGVLTLGGKQGGAPFTGNDEQVAVQASKLLGAAISTCELMEDIRLKAITDGLTGLHNHRYFQDALDRELSRAGRYAGHLSLIMLDIDHFKKFNDTYGHQEGDRVLEAVALQIRNSTRDVDIVARYGGEEFAVVLPETSLDGARIVAERIRANVENNRVKGRNTEYAVTVSVGVAPFLSGQKKSELIKAADACLYRAKENGRNRVAVAAANGVEK